MTTAANLARIGALPLVERIASLYRVPLSELLDRRVQLPTVRAARRHAWALVHDTFAFSTTETARVFGVDHSSVCVALAKRRRELEEQHA